MLMVWWFAGKNRSWEVTACQREFWFKSPTCWKVKILGKLGQWRDRIMVIYFILHFGQNWRNALCSWIMWSKEVDFPFFLEVERRTWGNRGVHEHTPSIFLWHPKTSASIEFLGLNTVAKNIWFLPRLLRLKWARQDRKREFSPWITKGMLGPRAVNFSCRLLPSIAWNKNLDWAMAWAQVKQELWAAVHGWTNKKMWPKSFGEVSAGATR